MSRHHLGDHIATALVVGIMSGVITFLEVAQPTISEIANILPLPAKQSAPVEEPQAAPTPAPVTQPVQPAAVESPVAPAPPPAPVATKAVTNSFVHMRSGKGTQFPIVMDLQAGTEIELRDDSNAQWQGIIYGGKEGYLFKAYVTY